MKTFLPTLFLIGQLFIRVQTNYDGYEHLNNCDLIGDFLDRSDRAPNHCESVDSIILEQRQLPNGEMFWCFLYLQTDGQENQVEFKYSTGYLTEFFPAGISLPKSGLQQKFRLPPNELVRIAVSKYPNKPLTQIESVLFNGKELCVDQVIIHTKSKTHCGVSKVKTATVANVGPGDWPWHAAVSRIDGTIAVYKCGGTIIGRQIVLSASHCILELGQIVIPERISVSLGQQNLNNLTGVKKYNVKSIILHPDFNKHFLFKHDIVLLKLHNDIEYTMKVQPICLPTSDVSHNRYAVIVGWGKTSAGLRQTLVKTVSRSQAFLDNNIEFFDKYLTNSSFWAGTRANNGGVICRGDSGGGLYQQHNGIWQIYGIISIGNKNGLNDKEVGCKDSDYVLLAKVYYFVHWIKGFL